MSIFDSPLLKPFHDMGAKAGAKAADKIIQSINNKKTDTKSCLESSGSYDEGLKKIMVKCPLHFTLESMNSGEKDKFRL